MQSKEHLHVTAGSGSSCEQPLKACSGSQHVPYSLSNCNPGVILKTTTIKPRFGTVQNVS